MSMDFQIMSLTLNDGISGRNEVAMVKISKKLARELSHISVADKSLRERFESSMSGYFADHAPDSWDGDQRAAFDLAYEVEDNLRAAILEVLGVKQ